MPSKGSALLPNQPFHLTPPPLLSVAEAVAGERRRWGHEQIAAGSLARERGLS